MPRFLPSATGLLAGDKEAAQDAVDDAFSAIWQQAANLDRSGSAEGWTRRIVRNKAIDWCRKQREAPMTDAIEAELSDQAGTSDPFQHTAQSAEARQLRETLAILSVEQREAIWLCYFEELSIREIAAIAGCPENAVKTRLFHARKNLGNSTILKAAANA